MYRGFLSNYHYFFKFNHEFPFIILPSGASHAHSAVKIFAGVFFKQLQHGVMYESSVPLAYEAPKMQQDVLQAESVFWLTRQQADCNMADAIQLYKFHTYEWSSGIVS